MNCKNCNAEMGEDAKVCPACGEAVTEITPNEVTPKKKERKKWVRKPLGKTGKAVIAAVCCAVVLLGLVAIIINSMGINVFSWKNDIYYKNRYTVSDAAAERARNRVVATVGDAELTNGVLQVYYAVQVWEFVENYSSYLGSLGLDLSRPLSEQYMPDYDGVTWEQYFLSLALDTWLQQQTIVCMGEEAQFVYPEGLLSHLEELPESLNTTAQTNGYEDAAAMLAKEYGNSSSVEDYVVYCSNYNKSMEYYTDMFKKMKPTDDEVETYFDENAEDIKAQYGITKVECPVVDVRHILIVPEGGTKDANGNTTYKKKQWIECREKAQSILDEWLAGEATEESFAELANTYSEDPGSNTNGGLYEYVYEGDMVPEFNDWCFDETRQYGDTDLVQTSYGYHIMYFVYRADEWFRYSSENLKNVQCHEKLVEASERYAAEANFSKMVLSELDFY